MKADEKKWTLEEGLEECAEMEKGKKHTTEDYIVKIGTIRPCHTCGKPVDVVSYGSYMLDQLSVTECEEHEIDIENVVGKPPFKKCIDPNCEFHKHFDEEEYYNDSMRIKEIIKEVNSMLNTVKPKIDSIMEYDRMCTLFGHSHPHMKPDDYEFWLYKGFIDYFGLQGKLRV